MLQKEGQRFRFSEAPVWEWQRAYYEQEGMQAWANHQVPQFITSNPMIATAYAEMIFGLLQDLAAKGQTNERVTIVELGAGAGRLAHQVLCKLCELKQLADGLELPAFRYVMTDLVIENISGWKNHPFMQSFIAQGILDFARFDAMKDTELKLVLSEEVIAEGDLQQPLILIANYFFDSIPQDLIYIGDGEVFECDLLVESPKNAISQEPAEMLKNMTLHYEYRSAPEYYASNPLYSKLIELYKVELEDSHILFPSSGLACLERLNKLSRSGYVLISADKGDHRLEYWKYAEPPEFVLHGSFSLSANYHAIRYVTEQQGAMTCFTDHHYKDLNVGVVLMLDMPASYVNTRLAYHRFVERYGPDDYFSMREWTDHKLAQMELKQILPFWRLGGYDAEFLIHAALRIKNLLPDASDEEMLDIQSGIKKMWSTYYDIEQREKLALLVGQLFMEMFVYEDARTFLEISLGKGTQILQPAILYDLAICCYELELEEESLEYARSVLEIDPEHEEAAALLESLQ